MQSKLAAWKHKLPNLNRLPRTPRHLTGNTEASWKVTRFGYDHLDSAKMRLIALLAPHNIAVQHVVVVIEFSCLIRPQNSHSHHRLIETRMPVYGLPERRHASDAFGSARRFIVTSTRKLTVELLNQICGARDLSTVIGSDGRKRRGKSLRLEY